MFEDGFEPPQTSFSSWSGVTLEAGNALTQSQDVANGGTYSMRVDYAGNTSANQASANLNLDAGIRNARATVFIYLPAAMVATLTPGARVRILRLGDITTAQRDVRTTVQLVKDSDGVRLRFSSEESVSGFNQSYLCPSLPPLGADTWHRLGVDWDAPGRIVLWVNEPNNRCLDLDDVETNEQQYWQIKVGLASFVSHGGTSLRWYMDDFKLETFVDGGRWHPEAADGGVTETLDGGADGGMSLDGGGSGGDFGYRVGCGCAGSPGLGAFVLSVLVALSLRARRGSSLRTCA